MVAEIPDPEPCYWRILSRKGELLVACMQWFDEPDYDKAEYLFGDLRFGTKEEAQAVVSGMKSWLGGLMMERRA